MQEKQPPNSSFLDHETLRALTRLLIGGGITGVETLVRQMRAWEEELEQLRSMPVSQQNGEDTFQLSHPSTIESPGDLLRYAFIGWLVESEDRTIRRVKQIEKITLGLWKVAEPWARLLLKPLNKSHTLAALRQRYGGFQARGEAEVRRWIELGREEELRGRDLAHLAIKRTVDQNIAYLARNPELEQLVETQSSGLANEVVEEVRERTVSADTFLEGLARSLLRRVPRSELPDPPETVRKTAEGLRPPKKTPHKRQP